MLNIIYLYDHFDFFGLLENLPVHCDVIVKLTRFVVVQVFNAIAYLWFPLAHLAEVAESAEALFAGGRCGVDVDTAEKKLLASDAF